MLKHTHTHTNIYKEADSPRRKEDPDLVSVSANRVRECYMFGNGMSSLFLTELADLNYSRGLANPHKERDTDWFPAQEP